MLEMVEHTPKLAPKIVAYTIIEGKTARRLCNFNEVQIKHYVMVKTYNELTEKASNRLQRRIGIID